MIDSVRFIFPNLDRRKDRWEWCKSECIKAGVPENQIERVSAYDGLDYLSDKGDPYDVSRLKEQMCDDFGEPLPAFLEKSTGVDYVLTKDPRVFSENPITAYAWSCTWYKCLAKISAFPENAAAALLIDDNALGMPYEAFVRMVSAADNSCRRRWGRMFAIQLGRTPAAPDAPPNRRGKIVVGTCELQHGFAAPDDMALVYTAAGARFMMGHVNRLAERNIYIDPYTAVLSIRQANAIGGFFAPSYDRVFFKRAPEELNYIKPPITNPEGRNLTDRELGLYKELWPDKLDRTGKL